MSGLRVSCDDRGVVRIVLDRPQVRNAFDDALIEGLTHAVTTLPDGARLVVLQGEGPAFCAGADLRWMQAMAEYSREENVADASRMHAMFEALDACAVPTVARVHGAAVAGATGLVACCDVAVAASDAVFAFTEVRLGLVPAVISPFVVRKVGYAFARSAFLTAERFDAGRALQVGLVHRVVDPAELDAAVEDVVTALLAAAPGAVLATRNLLNAVHGADPHEAGELTASVIADARVGEEGQEGMAAFFERRAPRWSGTDT